MLKYYIFISYKYYSNCIYVNKFIHLSLKSLTADPPLW